MEESMFTPVEVSRVQVAMFKSIFKLNLESAETPEMCFAKAVASSHDEIFKDAVRLRPDLIRRYLTRVDCWNEECEDMGKGHTCLSHCIGCPNRIEK